MLSSVKKSSVNASVFIGAIVIFVLVSTTVGFVGYYNANNANNIQTNYNQLKTDYYNLQTNYNDLLSNYNQLQSSSTSQSQTGTIDSQTSQIASLQSQISELNGTIESLQTQLSNATAIINQLQGPTGILPIYSDLVYVGPYTNGGSYFLSLSLKNTGHVPITQIFITINSVQVTMPFTYLNTTVSTNTPLPSYQTATGRQNVTPPVTNSGTYPLIIQAIANNGTTYTYQTTVTSHG